jgi:hypothetical protein
MEGGRACSVRRKEVQPPSAALAPRASRFGFGEEMALRGLPAPNVSSWQILLQKSAMKGEPRLKRFLKAARSRSSDDFSAISLRLARPAVLSGASWRLSARCLNSVALPTGVASCRDRADRIRLQAKALDTRFTIRQNKSQFDKSIWKVIVERKIWSGEFRPR